MPSTNYDPRYDMSNLMAVVDVTAKDARIVNPRALDLVVDALDQRLLELIYALVVGRTHLVRQYESITTITYREYGTTTLWWLVLTFNGLASALQLQPGMELKLPTRDSIDRALDEAVRTSNVGKIVQI